MNNQYSTCARCGQSIKNTFEHDGKVYGSECIYKVTGMTASEFEYRQKESKRLEDMASDRAKQLIQYPNAYICIDPDSYSKKDLLKTNGYKWLGGYWVGLQTVEGVELLTVETSKLIYDLYFKFDYEKVIEVMTEYKRSISRSNWVGNIKDKLELTVQITKTIFIYGAYGTTYIYIMEDKDGNIFTWKTNKDIEKENNVFFNIKGTVKEHDEYKDEKQTVLTRCKVI